MIERVARAIAPAPWKLVDLENARTDFFCGSATRYETEQSKRQARAAIEAMREPTEAMVRAAYDCAPGWAPYEAAKSDYQAMIDAALKAPETAA